MSEISNTNMKGEFEPESEISLVDIVDFVQESWRPLLVACIAGAILGLGTWFSFVDYKAEVLLQNKNAFDIISWRATERILPKLAAEMLEKKAVPDSQAALYKKISSPVWWRENVQVNFALTKMETKNLATTNKLIENSSASILSFAFTVSAPSEVTALNEAREVVLFIRNGLAYIAIKNLFNDYEINSLSQAASVQQKISSAEIELAYLNERAKNLELLQKRYPSATNLSQQVVDPKDTGAKYLPLSTQIIAINNDINTNKETLERLNDQLIQVKAYKVLLDEALPLMVGRFDGISMIKDLLILEEKLRAKTTTGDIKVRQSLDNIRAQFLNIEMSSNHLLVETNTPTVGKSGMLKNVATGSLITGFLILSSLLGKRIWRMLKLPAKS